MNLLNRLKRFYYRLRNCDPVKNCPVYLEKGCFHVDGPICPFPKECNLVRDHLDSKWTSCCECNFIDSCCSNQFGFGCYKGEKMKTVDNNLLIQDLCSRLPYNSIEVGYCGDNYVLVGISHGRCILCKKFSSATLDIFPLVEEVRPYLFPLSENHEKEICKICCPSYGEYSFHDDIYGRGVDIEEAYEFYKYCYKNNIDFLGLISKGLAINATGLNIY